jgi:hypothetical protein
VLAVNPSKSRRKRVLGGSGPAYFLTKQIIHSHKNHSEMLVSLLHLIDIPTQIASLTGFHPVRDK